MVPAKMTITHRAKVRILRDAKEQLREAILADGDKLSFHIRLIRIVENGADVEVTAKVNNTPLWNGGRFHLSIDQDFTLATDVPFKINIS